MRLSRITAANAEEYHCRDCVHATDFHDRNYRGEFFMCRCPFQARSMFLNLSFCDNFKKRQ